MGCCTSLSAGAAHFDYEIGYEQLKHCDEYEFFNVLQNYGSFCIDAQTTSNYLQSHVKYAMHLPFEEEKTITDSEIAIPIIDHQKELPHNRYICLYVNNVHNDMEKNNILRIVNILYIHKIVTDISSFFVLSVEFDQFKSNIPFYCGEKEQYPVQEKIHELYPNIITANKLYLGDVTQAKNKAVLQDLGISHILNCTIDWSNCFEHEGRIKYLRVPINDNDTDNIFDHFEKAISFIEAGDIVFVHCQAGISRSASIIIAYLMKTQNMDYQAAFEFVRHKRQLISPNDGFIEQLNKFEQCMADTSKT